MRYFPHTERDIAQMLEAAGAADLDALVIPGGFGAAKNLCGFADDGPDCEVDPDVEKLIGDMLDAKKPVGAICIAPALLARVAASQLSACMTRAASRD